MKRFSIVVLSFICAVQILFALDTINSVSNEQISLDEIRL